MNFLNDSFKTLKNALADDLFLKPEDDNEDNGNRQQDGGAQPQQQQPGDVQQLHNLCRQQSDEVRVTLRILRCVELWQFSHPADCLLIFY